MRTLFNILKAWVINTIIFIFVTLIPILLGPIVVAIGLLFSRIDSSQLPRPFTDYKKDQLWKFVRLPRIFLWWDNLYDGFRGDTRGWWAEYADEKVFFGLLPLLRKIGLPINKLESDSYLAMWWWGAVRNPANWIKRNFLNMDIRQCTCEVLAGQDYVRDDFQNTGFQLLRAVRIEDGKTYWRVYWVRRWGSSNRAIVVEFGYEFAPKHWTAAKNGEYDGDREYKNFKAFAYGFNPFKDIS